MGTASAIAAICELPTLFLFGYIIRKFRCDLLLKTAGIFFTIKALGTLLAPGIPVFYGVQIFQMLGWGLMTAASVYYVNALMEPEDAIKGQAYFTMAYYLSYLVLFLAEHSSTLPEYTQCCSSQQSLHSLVH